MPLQQEKMSQWVSDYDTFAFSFARKAEGQSSDTSFDLTTTVVLKTGERSNKRSTISIVHPPVQTASIFELCRAELDADAHTSEEQARRHHPEGLHTKRNGRRPEPAPAPCLLAQRCSAITRR